MAERELYDLEVGSVDLVGRAANGRKWLLWKSNDAPEPEDVDKAMNVAEWLESRIHQDFTVTADNMFGEGRLSRDERIALSSAIGDALDAFRRGLEGQAAQLYDRSPYADADSATKSADLEKAKVSTRDWSSVDKSKLPRSCFLYTTGDNKADWHLPVYEGGGEVGEDGMYSERGALNANAVRAALAAVGGARTGKAMSVPSEVKATLDRLAAQCGIRESSEEKAKKADESEPTAKGGESDMAEETKDVVTKEQVDAMQKALDDAKAEAEAQKTALAKAQERIEAQEKAARQRDLAPLCKDADLDFEMVWKAEQTMPEVAAHFIEKFDALTKQVNKLLGIEAGTERHDDRDDVSRFEGEVEKIAKEQKIPVGDAMSQVAKEHPEWAEAHRLANR